MTLFSKFIVIMVLLSGGAFGVGFLGSVLLEQREAEFVEGIGGDIQSRLEQGIALTSQGAVDEAVLLATDPAVVGALRLAASGDREVEVDPFSERARQDLRAHFGPQRAAWKRTHDGEDLRVHVHLPSSRSLLRFWKDKQNKSDDLRAFRDSVNQIAKDHQAIRGIEVGRGGFVIRGIAPVVDAGDEYLGSVEVLRDFDGLAASLPGDVVIYMEQSLLDVATELQDPTAHPVTGGQFVLVSAEGDWRPSLERLVAGNEALTVWVSQAQNHAAFPIHGWNGEAVGVAVVTVPYTTLQGGIDTVRSVGFWVLIGGLLSMFGGGYWLVQVNVLRPVRQMTQVARDIADQRADLSNRIQVARRDELGALADGFNRILDRIVVMARESAVLAGHLQELPLPVLKMNKQFEVIFLNQAAVDLIGKPAEECVGKRCYDLLRAGHCQHNCAVERCMATGALTTDDTRVGLSSGKANMPVQYAGLPLFNERGEVEGALEVVTDLSKLYDILGNVRDVSASVLDASQDLEGSAGSLDARSEHMASSTASGERAVSDLTANLGEITAAAVEMTVAVNSVASAVEEMTSTISEVAHNTATTSNVASQVNERSRLAHEAIMSLKASANSIDKVVDVISAVASQTNLLALNASIEAASAGDAGKGFAVVATEVKALANRTKLATGEIRTQIERIQADTARAVHTMEDVSSGIQEVAELSQSGAAAVEQQSAALREIAHNTSQVSALADGVSDQVTIAYEHSGAVAEGIRAVSAGVEQNVADISVTRAQATGLATLAEKLRASLQGFRLL